MELDSALYDCLVMHNRLAPKKHSFHYHIFMFWLDIDALANTGRKLKLFSTDRSNIFSFRHSDHFKFPKGDDRNALSVRQKLDTYLSSKGIEKSPAKVYLLTHVRMFGYVFNPVSFYFCYDITGVCSCVVTEISNTFGEMKLFLIDKQHDGGFSQNEIKYFYVSPFTDMDTEFEFRYQVPLEKLQIQINVKDGDGSRFFISTLSGKRKSLTDARLLFYVFRFPFVTLKVIGAIHWQAMKLWIKKLPFHKKKSDPELQRGITNRTI